ncbi:MAG: hypothetical protein ACRD9L_06325, partial [Bryobacteraceae bacterium]
MAPEAVSYRDDVEQTGRRFGELRQAWGTIAPTGSVVGYGGEAGAAGRGHSYGAEFGRGPAKSSEVDGSIRASRIH